MQMLICLLFSQFISVAQSCLTLCNPMDCSMGSLSITSSWSLLRLMSIELVMPSNHLNLCRSLLLLPSIFPNIRVFSNESALSIRWPSTEASVLQCATFFMVQLSSPYMTTIKTIALTIWTFVSKVMSLFLNTLSRFIKTFVPRRSHLLI